MTTETQKPDGETAQTEQKTAQVPEGPKSLDEALQLINHLKGIKSEAFRERDELKTKLKTFEDEKTKSEAELLAEQGKFKELYEKTTEKLTQVETTLRNKAVDSALKDILQKAGARSVDTVSKLIDKSKVGIGDDYSVDANSIQAQIEELKKSDPILFGVGEGNNLPPAKRPGDGVPNAGFEQEMRAAKTQKDIELILAKYGKI
jgi:vacuolar-type H+-ATPase subunit I/STV1